MNFDDEEAKEFEKKFAEHVEKLNQLSRRQPAIEALKGLDESYHKMLEDEMGKN